MKAVSSSCSWGSSIDFFPIPCMTEASADVVEGEECFAEQHAVGEAVGRVPCESAMHVFGQFGRKVWAAFENRYRVCLAASGSPA